MKYCKISDTYISKKIILKKSKFPDQLTDIFEKCILSSLIVQAKVGGYIIVFSCISGLFCQTLNLHPSSAIILGSILEISSGLGAYNVSPITTHYVALISALTSFGGICTICQIFSCICDLDISKKLLIYSKIFSSIITYVIVLCVI